MRKIVPLIFSITIFALTGCRQPGYTPPVELSGVLVDFPSVLALQSRSPGVRDASPAAVIDYLGYVYAPIRDTYNPLALGALACVNTLFTALDENVFGNYYIMREVEKKGYWTGSVSGSTRKYAVILSEDTYTVQVWEYAANTYIKTLHLSLTDSEGYYSGTAYAREASAAPETKTYKIDFNTADPDLGQVAEITAVNLEPDDPAGEEIPRKLWMKAWQKDASFFAAANIFYTRINIEENSPFHTEFMAQLTGDDASNVKGSYMYTASVTGLDAALEYAAANLALVKESSADNTGVFTGYSVGALYREAAAAWLRTDPLNQAGTERIVLAVNNILAGAGAAERIPDPPGSATTAEIFTALQKTKEVMDAAGQTSAELDAVLFVVKLVNPAYYDADGFTGTEELDKPAWADQVPALPDSAAITPTAADISAEDFTVTMPQDTAPGF